MLKIQTSRIEVSLLTAHIKTAPIVLVRYKAQAVLLASQGVKPGAIGLAVDRKPRTVSGWLKDWSAKRMTSIFSGHSNNNNASKLTKDQQAQIKEVLARPPSEYGIPKAMWDVPILKDYISAQFDVVYESDESYYLLLRFSGLSFKYPDTFDLKRNEPLVFERMKAIRTEIAPLLESADWEVFACDEVKMQQDAIIRRCWLKKGQRTVVKVNRDKQSQSYIRPLSRPHL